MSSGFILKSRMKWATRLTTTFLVMLTAACRSGGPSVNDAQILYTSPATFVESYCVSNHVREFINLNEERSKRYAELSDNRSLSISKKLIAYERIALATLPLIENQALKYQRAGVPLLCLDVVAMHSTPNMNENLKIPSKPFMYFDGGALSKKLLTQQLVGNEVLLEKELENALARLNENHSYNCLLRHFVESTLRTVRLVPKYRAASKKRGLPNPSLILSAYINSQILFFGTATQLDLEAAPLQSEGIPVLCDDVPPIPLDVSELLND
ncbi:MAG: hypothetical protein ACO3A4_11835 [Silvanigrellaceae bacterium]